MGIVQVMNGREMVVTKMANLSRVASGLSNAGRKLKIVSNECLASLTAEVYGDIREDIEVEESADFFESERRDADRVGGGVAKPSSVIEELAVVVPPGELLIVVPNQLRRLLDLAGDRYAGKAPSSSYSLNWAGGEGEARQC